jgi:hypothetical protein
MKGGGAMANRFQASPATAWIHVKVPKEVIEKRDEIMRMTGWSKSDCIRNLIMGVHVKPPELSFDGGGEGCVGKVEGSGSAKS